MTYIYIYICSKHSFILAYIQHTLKKTQKKTMVFSILLFSAEVHNPMHEHFIYIIQLIKSGLIFVHLTHCCKCWTRLKPLFKEMHCWMWCISLSEDTMEYATLVSQYVTEIKYWPVVILLLSLTKQTIWITIVRSPYSYILLLTTGKVQLQKTLTWR